MRMSRRMGLVGQTLPDLETFWRNISVTKISGDSSSIARAYNYILGSTETPQWVFYSVGGDVRIDKVKNNTTSLLFYNGTLQTLGIGDDSTTEDTRVKSGEVYGCCLMAFRCPNYTEAVVDKRLQNMAMTVKASRYDSSTGNPYMSLAPAANTLYMQAFGYTAEPWGYWSMCNGSSPLVAIKRAGGTEGDTFPFWYPSTATKYYLSRTGTTNTAVRSGGIFTISEA